MERRIIVSDFKAADAEEVIRMLCHDLESKGFVDSEYVNDVLAREKDYPTGLPTQPIKVAIPHADSTHVRDTGIALARLENPVEFYSMEMSGELYQVNLVFLLAISEQEKMNVLSNLVVMLQDQEVLKKLAIEDDVTVIQDLINQNMKGCELQ